MKHPPSPLAIARRRVRQLERCLDDLGRSLDLRARELFAEGRNENTNEYRLIAQLTRRIGRTVRRQPPRPPEADASAGINHNLNQG